MGQKGITDFFQAYQKDPSTGVEQFFSADVIKKNPAIFNPKGRPPRRTLADVMTKFDEVGGGRSRTPIREEDSSMGVAMQVAQRADRGDVGPGYEDANMQAAYAMAQDLESSPKMASRMALLELLDKGKPAIAPVPQYQIPVEPNIGDQIKARLLERYTNPGIMAGAQGFSQGGMVKGYSGADGISSVAVRNPDEYYRYNPLTGQLEVDPNAPPYMPDMRAVDRGEIVPQFEYTDAELAREFGFGGKSTTGDAKNVAPSKPKKYYPLYGTAFLMGEADMPPDAVTGSAEKHREFLKSQAEKKKYKGDGGRKPSGGSGFTGREFADMANWLDENITKPALAAIPLAAEKKDFMSLEEPWLEAVPYNLGVAGLDIAKSIGGAGIAGLGALGTGAGTLLHGAFGRGPTVPGSTAGKPAARPAARPAVVESNINKSFQTALAGPSGTFETSPYRRGIAAGMEPPATGGSIAPTGQTPVVPAAPPVQRNAVDVIANQFLNEMKAAQSSKEDMRNMALLQAGLGMMAGQSPFFATNVGQGAMAGLQAYQQAKAQNQQLAAEAMDNMLKARALELDKRRVDVSESSAQSEADYRKRSLDLQAQKIEQDVREFLSKGAAGISQEDLAKMANDRIEFARKEQTNPLSQYYNKTDVEIENMVRADLMRALNIAKSASGGVAVKKMGSAI